MVLKSGRIWTGKLRILFLNFMNLISQFQKGDEVVVEKPGLLNI